MKVVAYTESLPATDPRSLFDHELPMPTPGPRDLRVRIRAIAVNPVDTKIRMRRAGTDDAPVVLGWDAAGVVDAIGAEVTLFKAGDEVMYAGDIGRAGTYAEYGLVDERIAGRKPSTLSFAEAAALPLTSITAWEALFDRLRLPRIDAGDDATRGRDGAQGAQRADDALLVIGAAGGVGSIAVQLARQLTGLTVIGTASRPESQAWVTRCGAHEVVDHGAGLAAELERIGHPRVRHVLSLTHTDRHWDDIATLLAPQGQVCLIDDPGALDIGKLKQKAGALHWEFMFTRAMFQTDDMVEQHRLLCTVADMVDAGQLRTTLGRHLGTMDAARLREAHALIESGSAIGKLVLDVA